ncbi:glycosyltransferase family 2 protein [Baudoinia panamericana UAMH 10762]|uniref:Glycosyltransferase family 2 protein n=1 Tax=Baudoinia panamericana (strain UAMH 10762) TaxID=717646 RepID=M2LPM0_BAUPA|nr:glycosyltransferase family 2 protein [Baudoinia panamericana UAMH 10762]EMC96347.1 glycosyltransferase family 2 protein [Baudoinia panamericana UAMH 10762]
MAAGAVVNAVDTAKELVTNAFRRSSLNDVYEKAKSRGEHLKRKKWVMLLFEYSVYALSLAFIYFVLVGVPLWKGTVWWLYWVVSNKFVVAGTWSVTIGLAIIYAFPPLLMLFEKEPPMPEDLNNIDATKTPNVHNVALLIPCYKSAKIIGPTLEAALKIFPRDHIFIVANGNSPTPLDNTEEVCKQYGVNHVWSPIGSKLVAQFVGCYAAKHFENVLIIDDDCSLPPNFPIVSDRLKGKVGCIGYTIKSVGPDSTKGTLCHQAQDLEYKLSGLQRQFAGFVGSATFAHGAISLWNTQFLIKTFYTHPGFSVSEDWFFGHVARKLGCRIKMCSAIFVETETPPAIFFSGGGSRGGFGEMTIFKQRFYRWNFFFVNGLYYNMGYILGSWKLGFWELGAKLFVFQEVYETLLYLIAPFMLPISFIVRPAVAGYLTAATFVLYFVTVTIFNEVHLRLRNERVGFVALYIYYMPYKFILTVVNIGSCYYSLYKYAKYFAKRHPKVIEDERAVEVVLRLDERRPANTAEAMSGRRMTVGAVGLRLGSVSGGRMSISPLDVQPNQRLASITENTTPSTPRRSGDLPWQSSDALPYDMTAAPKLAPVVSNPIPPKSDVVDFAEQQAAARTLLSPASNDMLLRTVGEQPSLDFALSTEHELSHQASWRTDQSDDRVVSSARSMV